MIYGFGETERWEGGPGWGLDLVVGHGFRGNTPSSSPSLL